MPVQAQVVDPSAFPVPVQVPLAFIPSNLPVPRVACHLSEPDCIWPFLEKRLPGNEFVYTGKAMREADLLRKFVEGFQDSKECSDISLYLKTDRKPEFTLAIVVSGKSPMDRAWTWAFSEARGRVDSESKAPQS